MDAYASRLAPWYKKDVVFDRPDLHLELAVAQELFSSHDIDTGSRLLLRALEDLPMPARGFAVDYGCGYGILGAAVAAWHPSMRVTFVDRDALATAFTAWNIARLGPDVASRMTVATALDIDDRPESGWDLVLWNVPGKAGVDVLRGLALDVAGSLATHGLAALVIVNPLADALVEVLTGDPHMTIEVRARHVAHTIVLARRTHALADRTDEDSFARGRYDRPVQSFAHGEHDWTITPVFGLPEYESLSYPTVAALGIVESLASSADRVLIQCPGQGHVPLVVARHLRPRHVAMADRDLLALRTSARACTAAAIDAEVTVHAQEHLDVLPREHDLAVLMLDEPLRSPVVQRLLGDLTVGSVDRVIIAGTSTGVSRFLAAVRKHGGWKVRDRTRRSGASAALLVRRDWP